MKDKTCAERVRDAYSSRMEDIITLYEAENQQTEELGWLYNYGLSIDRVEANTFKGQKTPYTRYQLSWGGPSEEFRVYDDGNVEFWFLDWYDGASIPVTGREADIIRAIVSK